MNDVIEAIKSRRSVRKMQPDPPVTKEQVETIIEASIWAPTHHMTEPWRFVVLAGDERRKLGDAMSDALLSTSAERPAQERLELERNRPLSASVIIALISSPKVGSNILPQEEMVAAGAALQNMLLAAHSLGVAAMIRTGSHAYSETIRIFFEMRESETLVGLIYLGHVAEQPPPGKRKATSEKVVWRGM